MRRFLLLAALALSALAPSFAQSPQTGLYEFGPYDSPGADTINRGNLNVHLTIPVFSKPGRAGSNFSFALNYDSTVWTPSSTSGSGTWQPAADWGWSTVSNAEFGYVTYQITTKTCYIGVAPHQVPVPLLSAGSFRYHDQKGRSHPFAYSYTAPCNTSLSFTGSGSYAATDNSGYSVYRNANAFTAFTKTGEQYSVSAIPSYNGHPTGAQPGAGTYTDTNGNQIAASYNSSTGTTTYTDTTGATVLTATGSGTAASPTVYTYTDTTGTARTVTVNYTNYNVTTKFGVSGVAEYSGTGIPLVSSIVYADGSRYSFAYENTPGSTATFTGRLASVTLPTGGAIAYAYNNPASPCAATIESDGSASCLARTTADGTVSYVRSAVSATASTTTYADATTPTANTIVSTFLEDTQGYIYETSRSVYQGAASGTPLQQVTTCYVNANPCAGNSVAAPIQYRITTVAQNGITVAADTQQYSGGFLVNSNDGYVNEATAYQSFAGADGIGFARVSSVTDTLGSTKIAQTSYAYDQTALASFGGAPQPAAETSARGNLTTVSPWLNTTNATSGATTIVYDTTGTAQSSTGPTGTSAYAYDGTDSFLQRLTPPTPSSGVSLPSAATYDTANTGLPLTAADPNNQAVTYKTYDELLRPTEIDFPDGGKTTASYTPAPSSPYGGPFVGVTSYQNASQSASTETLYDGYGRVSRVAVYNGQSASIDWYQQDACYDANGRLLFQSYAYQGSGFTATKVCSGAGDTYAYDALGRVATITHADATSVSYAYKGRATQATDENGVSRITQINGHGQIASVCEISSATLQGASNTPASCGTDIAGTGFVTTYAYAADTSRNQVTTVTQGQQTRTFKTDSLGRTVYASEPEHGVTNYAYAYSATAGLGLKVTRTRPQANQTSASVLTTTTTQYDALGRVVSVTYNDGLTPAKTYAYDVSQQWGGGTFPQSNIKGRLSLAAAGPSRFFAATTYSYDAMGRIGSVAECLPSTCWSTYKQLNYTYDWLGNQLSSSDGNPNGLQTNYTYTSANEYQSVVSTAYGVLNPGNLVTSIANGPNGPISYDLGNGLSGYNSYDALGRLNGKWVCSGSNPAPNCGNSSVVYGFTTTWRGQRLLGSTDSVVGTGAYNYDDFNRLALTSYNNGANKFSELYDRYGNRWQQNMLAGEGSEPQLSFNASNQMVGYSYDAAGNVANDGYHSYAYDAEGQVLQIDGGNTETYTHDALGRRVRVDIPVNGSQAIEFYFNPSGQMVSEWNPATGTLTEGKYYWGGSGVAYYYDDGQTHFEHQNWLGTERARTSYDGAVETTIYSLPFGDGVTINGPDQDYDHFAGLGFDTWSDTHFAQFRQYSKIQGRWLSPDPYDGSYDFTNPQSLNRYSYALNNPLSYRDPLGLSLCQVGRDGSQFCSNAPSGGGDGGGCLPDDPSCANDPTGNTPNQDEGQYEQMLNCAMNPGSCDPLGPADETIYVACTGPDLFDFSCIPNNASMGYFAAAGNPSLTAGGIFGKTPATTALSFSAWLPLTVVAGISIPISVLDNGDVCGGIGTGFASPGRAFNGGVVRATSGNLEDVLGGASVSVTAQPLPWLGGQMSTNQSGTVVGNSFGTPGFSFTVSYSWCGELPGAN